MPSLQVVLLAAIALKGVAGAAVMDDEWHVKLLRRQAPGSPLYYCHDNCGQAITASRREGHCDNEAFLTNYANCLQCSGPDNSNIWRYYTFSLTAAGEQCGLSTTPLSGEQPAVGPAIPAGGQIPDGVQSSTTTSTTTAPPAPPSSTTPPAPASTTTEEPVPTTTDEPVPTTTEEPDPTGPPATTPTSAPPAATDPPAATEPPTETTTTSTTDASPAPSSDAVEESTTATTAVAPVPIYPTAPAPGHSDSATVVVPVYTSKVETPTPIYGSGNHTATSLPPPPSYTGGANALATTGFTLVAGVAVAILFGL
ncbi:hypothetical protein DRE_01292 [Drechslerella stenobrocha 248]|uniref:WSC domain-containing protein n=1 Tax=Drechslerella stenobrocha 248 TaxID=1043628 RepID=W7I5A6_9PEZI|nr:hypothetical protein DRE_01292 [Drechslerella stenobrocha 248]